MSSVTQVPKCLLSSDEPYRASSANSWESWQVLYCEFIMTYFEGWVLIAIMLTCPLTRDTRLWRILTQTVAAIPCSDIASMRQPMVACHVIDCVIRWQIAVTYDVVRWCVKYLSWHGKIWAEERNLCLRWERSRTTRDVTEQFTERSVQKNVGQNWSRIAQSHPNSVLNV